MTYDYRNRLTHNARRFGEINTSTVTYRRENVDPIQTIVDIPASPIFKRAVLASLGVSALRVDREHFAFDIDVLLSTDLDPVLFMPEEGDIIVYGPGDEYRVVRDFVDQPAYQYITTARDRILVATVREVIAE